jgi:hypothetical protein
MRILFRASLPVLCLVVALAGCRKTNLAAAQTSATAGPAVTAKAAVAPAASIAPAVPEAQKSPATAGFQLTGEVTRGQRFEKNVGSGLVFRLEPFAGEDSGWTIGLVPASEPSPASLDCIGPVSEPLHGSNKLSIDPAQASIVNGRTYWTPDPREFYFVSNASDCRPAWDLANLAYYPSKLTDQERELASEKLFQIRTGHGSFRILDSKLTVSTEKKPGVVEWLKFDLELAFASAPDAHGSSGAGAAKSGGIREIDLERFLKTRYAEVQPDLENLEQECGQGEQRIRGIKVIYGDLDGDGQDEAAYEGFTCMSGTAGVDFFGVLKRKPDGKLTALPIEAERKEFKGRRNLNEGLRGHLSLAVESGRLVEIFPVYPAGEPNCCPEGGERRFVYRWNGQVFVLDDIIDVPPEKSGS